MRIAPSGPVPAGLLRPGSWPLRWRLAAVSAGLTLVILMLFGAVVGGVATQRIRDDFNGEVRSAVQILAGEFKSSTGPSAPTSRKARASTTSSSPMTPRPASSTSTATCSKESTGADQSGAAAQAGIHDHRRGAGGDRRDHARQRYASPATSSTGAAADTSTRPSTASGSYRRRRPRRHPAGDPRRTRDRRPGDAADRLADRDRARDRHHPRPLPRMPKPTAEDEVGELALTLEEMLRSLDAARTEREGAMQKQREFVADASHELRTPLTSVLANLELLQASLGDRPGRGPRDRRFRAALLAADEPAGRRPAAARPRRRRTARRAPSAATWPRSPGTPPPRWRR